METLVWIIAILCFSMTKLCNDFADMQVMRHLYVLDYRREQIQYRQLSIIFNTLALTLILLWLALGSHS